jgi:predicted O-methyltransferase YrrM
MRDRLSKVAKLLRHPETTRFYLTRALWHIGIPGLALRPTSLEEIFPGIRHVVADVQLLYPLERIPGREIDLHELVILIMIERFTKAQRILEIGTLFGNTALNLAANTDGSVTTVDLPPQTLVDAATRGVQFREHSLNARIRQVYGDSASLDWETFGDAFDFIFIDGCHESQYVRSDSRNALGRLKPGGTIVWHNYTWNTVATVLDSYARNGLPLRWIKGTDFALATVANPAATFQTLSLKNGVAAPEHAEGGAVLSPT